MHVLKGGQNRGGSATKKNHQAHISLQPTRTTRARRESIQSMKSEALCTHKQAASIEKDFT